MENKELFELTNPQKSIWYTEQFYSETTVNNICTSGTVYGKINENLLKQAVKNVVKQNDSFRIRVVLENNIAKQYIADYKDFNIDVEYINDESEIERVEKEEVKYKFDVIDSDLFKFKLAISEDNFACIFLTVNHLIADSWALGLVIQEILRNYNALKNNEEITQETFSYVDYINSEKEYKSSKKFENDKSYWNEIFETIPEQATIPSLNNNIKNLSYNAKRLSFEINKELLSKINVFCRENNISTFNFFMAIFSIYIGRVSNIDDFVIGTPILNRSNFKEKHTTGMFVNTVPVRVNNLNDGTFKNLASDFATKMMGILRHQKYSYNSVLEDLRAKNENVPNLYNIIISYQVTKAFDEKFGDYKTNWTFNNYCANDFNIHIYDINDTGDLIINYDYLIDKYSAEDVIDVHNRIVHMINQVLTDNDIGSSDIEIVTPVEKDKILNVFNNTDVDYPRDKTIVDLFEEQVEKTPDNVAVVFEDKKLTYRELNEKANSLARYLINQDIKPGTVIGLRLNKRLEMIIGILAIIKSGCCYLPINMQYPQDRVDFMLSDSNAKLLLGTEDSLTDMEINLPKIDINLNNYNIYSYETTNLGLKISPEDLIYIIYTSGSTGKPKGAMLCHRNVVRLFKNDKFLFNFDENDAWTMFHSVAFDFSVWEMYGALLFGGKLVLVSDEVAQDPELFLNLMRKENVTVLNQTPTYFYKLLKVELEKEDTDLSVRYIVFGGEALKPNLIKGWYLKYPETKLINMYGITETTVHVTFKELSESDLESSSSNIGVPIPTLHVIVVDKNLKLLPFGTMGEMCVLGEGVFKGYLNREDLNETKLIKIPEYSDKLIYRSGDTAIMHKDGHLEYMGRIDTQVKIRGFRVELGEIEEKILKYSNIDTCIVTKKVDEFDRELLCAYYIKNGPLNISALRILLNKHLPAYMVPQYFIEIDKVPININGKTDFKALPLPQNAQTGVEMIKPRNEIDKHLLEIYEKFLHVNNVSMSDSFFELGGDSLTAINISETISKELNVEVTVKDILDKNIIMNLSDYISGLSNTDKSSFKILPAEEAEFYPLSSAQKRIYYASKMIGDENIVYNVPGAILVNSILDKEKVEKCFKEIIKKQSSFRTSFLMVNDSIMQKINKSVNFKINTFENKSTEINNLINTFPKAFNLENAPLLRVELHYLDNGKTLLLLESHHIIMDGSSLEILINEFCKLYNGENIDNLDIEYKDFSVWENKFLESDMVKDAENYWLDKFKDSEIPAINLPYDFSIPSSMSYKGNTISKQISEKDFDKYIISAKKFGVSPYMFFLSALFVLLYKYTGQEEIIVGSPVTGRNNNQLQDIIGMFVNNIAVDGKIDSSKKFSEFLYAIKQQVLSDLGYQNYPYNSLVKKLDIPNDSSNNPLFDVMFAYQNANSNKLTLGDESVEIIKSASGISKFNLSIEIEPDTRVVNLEYRTDLFKEDTINRLFEHFINTLNMVSEDSDILIKDISIISDEEKNKILYDFNNTHIDFNSSKTITQLIEEQVLKSKDKTAVIFKDNKFSYKELNEKANQLAFYLRSMGVKQNSIVGILIDRSIEMVICMLGILKAGGAYLPIDPTYPRERINYIIDDSSVNIILTKEHLKYLIDKDINVINVDLSSSDIYNSYAKDNLPVINTSSDLAYLIYTSGSTGKPKGVELTHKNVNNFIVATTSKIKFEGTIVSVTTFCFDIFVLESLLPLQKGLTIVLADEEEQNIPKLLNKICLKNNVTMIQTTPSRMSLLLSDSSFTYIKNLKTIMLGGEPFPDNLLLTLKNLTSSSIFNMYGPTETTVWSSIKDLSNCEKITIGKPIGNTQFYILDTNLNPVPIGTPGKLFIGGYGVAKGYYNKLELTKSKFINNPFEENDIIYDTGDIAKWTSTGEVICLGRSDFQVKIRVLRIELGEIENKILQFSNIKKAIVCVKTDSLNRQFLCAYFISDQRISISELKNYLNSFLPNYMIPNFLIQISDFPYTPNGKIDRKSLPDFNIQNDINNAILPKTKTQKQISAIFEKLLCISPISIDDNFFEIGGDSILALKLQIELLNRNINISYADIFVHNTIRKLSEKIDTLNDEAYQLDDNQNYDYSKINALLNKNNEANMINISNQKIDGVLLTGATGFLGIHILADLLDNTDAKVYCLLRKDPSTTVTQKLLNRLHYYFGNKYDSLLNNRFFVIEAKVTKDTLGISKDLEIVIANNISFVINSAAIVKHFGSYDTFRKTNVDIVNCLINFCLEYDKKLIQISTTSVSGNSLFDLATQKQTFNEDVYFTENKLYIGQPLDNVYIKTKFESEKLIFENIITKKLKALVLRVGNITNRFSDGKFQFNNTENAFANRLKFFLLIKCIPNYLRSSYIEFTPVDILADAIIRSIKFSNDNVSVLHLYNQNHLYMEKLVEFLYEENFKFVDDDYFTSLMKSKLNDEKNISNLSFILNDLDSNNKLVYDSKIKITNGISKKFLDKIGFSWPQITKEYIINLIKNI